MAEEERSTGTPNNIYNLSSVLFHALEGGASYDTYIEDAERSGDQELVEFFRLVRDEDSERADRAQELLAERTSTGGGLREGATTGATPSMEPSGVPPVTEDVPPRTEGTLPPGAEDVPPRTGEIPPRTGEAPPPVEDVPPRMEDVPPRAEGIPPRDEPGAAGVPPERPIGEVPPDTARPETEVPRGTPPDAPRGDVQRESSPEREREEDKGLIDRAIDKLSGRDEERREGPERR